MLKAWLQIERILVKPLISSEQSVVRSKEPVQKAPSYLDNRLTSSVLRKVTSSSFSVCKVLSSFEISLTSSVKRLILLSLLTNSILLYSNSASSWRILSRSLSFSWTTLLRSEPSSAAWRLSLPTYKENRKFSFTFGKIESWSLIKQQRE